METISHRSILKKARPVRGAIVGKVTTGYRRPPIHECPEIRSAKDAHDFIAPRWEDLEYRESFKVIYIMAANRIVGYGDISVGSVAACLCDAKIVYQGALAANASAIVLCHNHPSGKAVASEADINLTKRMKEAGKHLDIQVVDHIILCGDGKYFSFADEGMI